MNSEQAFLLLVLGTAAVASFLIVVPFLNYVLLAVVLAYVLYPAVERLRPRFGRRGASMVVLPVAMLVVFLPVGYVTLVLIGDLMALSHGETNLDTAAIESTIEELGGRDVDVSDSLGEVGTELVQLLFGGVADAVSTGASTSIGLGLTLFLLYYLLTDGDRFVAWVIDVAPMSNVVCSRLFDRIDATAWGVVAGHIFVAVLQGLVGGVGLLVAGIPNVVFWTFVMIVLALLPLIGAFFVWAPAAAYLYAVDEVGWAIFLAVYGALVVSTVDNYARPIVIDRGAHLNPGVVLVGVFGGVYAIGMTGLFVGPIVLAVLVATIEVFDEEFDTLGTA